jgi:hypothetical protein
VPESRRVDSLSPVLLKKSVKNPIEIEGMKRSHVSSQLFYSIRIDYHFNNVFNNKIKDAVALCEFFAWLEDEIPKGDVDELSAASKLEEFRRFQRFNQNNSIFSFDFIDLIILLCVIELKKTISDQVLKPYLPLDQTQRSFIIGLMKRPIDPFLQMKYIYVIPAHNIETEQLM